MFPREHQIPTSTLLVEGQAATNLDTWHPASPPSWYHEARQIAVHATAATSERTRAVRSTFGEKE